MVYEHCISFRYSQRFVHLSNICKRKIFKCTFRNEQIASFRHQESDSSARWIEMPWNHNQFPRGQSLLPDTPGIDWNFGINVPNEVSQVVSIVFKFEFLNWNNLCCKTLNILFCNDSIHPVCERRCQEK